MKNKPKSNSIKKQRDYRVQTTCGTDSYGNPYLTQIRYMPSEYYSPHYCEFVIDFLAKECYFFVPSTGEQVPASVAQVAPENKDYRNYMYSSGRYQKTYMTEGFLVKFVEEQMQFKMEELKEQIRMEVLNELRGSGQ